MTPDERNLLSAFLRDLTAARGVSKDPEADQMIGRALAANPDAAYLLVQHTIVADQSLHAAQARITELETQLRQSQPPPSPSFLPPAGVSPWGSQAAPAPPPSPGYQASPFSGGGGLGSFLRSAGTTAAGVAGGEMLFSGLSDLFGQHGGYGGAGFLGTGGAPENVTINNYDGDPGGFDAPMDGGDFGSGDDSGNW